MSALDDATRNMVCMADHANSMTTIYGTMMTASAEPDGLMVGYDSADEKQHCNAHCLCLPATTLRKFGLLYLPDSFFGVSSPCLGSFGIAAVRADIQGDGKASSDMVRRRNRLMECPQIPRVQSDDTGVFPSGTDNVRPQGPRSGGRYSTSWLQLTPHCVPKRGLSMASVAQQYDDSGL
ncbi:hypothetical protein B0T17DRAFT_504284 [Bombardia bombarda]|uniref:Uncharacterized protein n=1 Tax=Bombardia bombarda TaxID=252184 RepID=A0AA39XMQ0_9PEZI|nr:hypothetical protein B0T17DRAFT_504284 [Bombardia bombarda]